MCGIVGIYDSRRATTGMQAQLERARDLLQHRGPDDRGLWVDPQDACVLGHRRLSIIDLSSAQALGHRFRSHTDTEVIVHGYEEYGVDIISRLRGMFAFALYDCRRQQLLLARDRVGIKPFYHTTSGGTLLFASEIKSLLAMPGVEKQLDLQALREYLAFGKVYTPKTMFRGIMKLPAAHYMLIKNSGETLMQRYWSPYQRRFPLAPASNENEYRETLFNLLQESVRLRMRSDVPVGVFLSGGVDSTANVALMSRVHGSKVHTFTAGFQGQEAYDERSHARAAAQYFKFVSQLARRNGAIVILNGDGSDELFCGYNKYMQYLRLQPYWRGFNSLPRFIKTAVAQTSQRMGVNGVAGDMLVRASHEIELYIGATGALKGTPAFQEILNGKAEVYRAVAEGRQQFEAERHSTDYCEWLSYWGLRSEVEHVFLYRADRMGMANSIEIRVPFLDHHLVEFALQMPQQLKYKNGEKKYILKQALAGTVPEEFLHRKKQGFCVPIREWAGSMMHEKIFTVLPRLQSDWGVLSSGFMNEMRTRLHETEEQGFLSWNLYTLATWYERWFK
ncbi:MAG: hypothetical protein DYG95_29210 [Chlorobi bacterium CHB1]|nr:hypothetical protein [Chlorobi bacterium CHB1]